MNNYREIYVSLLRRLLPTLALGAFGWYLVTSAGGGWAATTKLLVGMVCLVTAGGIIAVPIARLLAEPWGNLYLPGSTFDRPQIVYGIGQAKRKKGLHQEAFDYFAGVASEFPTELKPYVEMMDIAIVDLKDKALADEVYNQGLSSLTTEEDRDGLTAMHKAILSRLSSRAPLPRRVISWYDRIRR